MLPHTHAHILTQLYSHTCPCALHAYIHAHVMKMHTYTSDWMRATYLSMNCESWTTSDAHEGHANATTAARRVIRMQLVTPILRWSLRHRWRKRRLQRWARSSANPSPEPRCRGCSANTTTDCAAPSLHSLSIIILILIITESYSSS